MNFDKAVADLPAELRGAKPPGVPHTPWQLLEHLRIAQWDILEFMRNPRQVSPLWPEGYWPADDGPPDDGVWFRSVAEEPLRVSFGTIREAMDNMDEQTKRSRGPLQPPKAEVE